MIFIVFVIMADSKIPYSNASEKYIEMVNDQFNIYGKKYLEIKSREEKYNASWCKIKVNLNDVVNKFAPNASGHVEGYKYIFSGDKYDVVTDMVAGYLRIYNRDTNQYVNLNGKPDSNNNTHFKIKRKEEM